MTSELIYANMRPFKGSVHKDRVVWSKMLDLMPMMLLDRSGHIQMPYNFKVQNINKSCIIPEDIDDFNLTYEECSEKRVKELLEISIRLDKPITILYSGGIDSTFVVISFMKYLSQKDFKEKIRIAMNMDSIQENFNFYYDYLRVNANIISSEQNERFYDKNTILVSGEHNDQLFGSDLMSKIYKMGTDWHRIRYPYTRKFIVDNFFNHYIDSDAANIWFDIIDDQIKHASPCEVKTNYDFLWWCNFSLKWQTVYFRMLMNVSIENKKFIDNDFFTNYYHHFYSSQDFQKWSMTNPQLKMQNNDWFSYKYECKRLIYEYNKDEEYFKTKFKIGSLAKLYVMRKMPQALTSSLDFIDISNVDDYYVPNNSFSSFG